MSTTITSAIQLTWNLASTVNLTVTDQGGTGTVTVGTGWFRPYIAPNTGAVGASSTSPTAFTSYLKALLNAHAGSATWGVTINSGGFIVISYNGTGTASITWDVGNVTRNLLGFTGASLSIPTGTTQTATYHPTHTLYTSFRDNDTNKLIRAQRRAGRDMPDGSSYSFRDNMQRVVQRFNSRAHPKDWATRTTVGSSLTPFLPDDTSRWKTPNATPGVAPPWSVIDTFAGGDQNMLGCLLGNFQSAVAGGVTSFDEFYFTSAFLKRDEWSKPTVADWYAMVDVDTIELSWFGTGSL